MQEKDHKEFSPEIDKALSSCIGDHQGTSASLVCAGGLFSKTRELSMLVTLDDQKV